MILQYERLWPEHPFVFRVPYQKLPGRNSAREEYIEAPPDIPGTVLRLIADLPDNEWIYWCIDDKYPIQLITDRFNSLFEYARDVPDITGLLCCRCRVTLEKPELALLPGRRTTPEGEMLLERAKWYQIWIHQFLRVKVLRYFFTCMAKDIPNAKVMDKLKNQIPKPDDFHLFVTERNYAVFGESTQRGKITTNCYRSVRRSGLELPEWFSRPNGESITMGELDGVKGWRSWFPRRN